MSLQPSPIGSVPHQRAHVAGAAFPKGTPYLTLRDELGTIFRDEDFADLFPDDGQPAYPPWRLALVTILQFRENLPDRQAAEAVRALNRLELLGETLRAALNEVATAAPEWLRSLAPPEWYERYGRRIEDSRLPQSKAKREAYAQTIGQDGLALLEAIEATDAPEGLSSLPSIQTLRRVWRSHFQQSGGDESPGEERPPGPPSGPPSGPSFGLQLKPGGELESITERIISPYDTEARYGDKGTAKWTGYRLHLSETCDAEGPRLLTHTMTTPAPKHDSRCTEEIHRGLLRKGLLPREHMPRVVLT